MSEERIFTQNLLVAALNNKAAVHIKAGDYLAAHQSLSEALVETRDCVQLQQGAEMHCSELNVIDLCSFRANGETEDRTAVQQQQQQDSCEALFIFRRPLHVNVQRIEQQLSTSLNTQTFIDILGFATVYNLALCQHLRAVSCSNNDSSSSSNPIGNLHRAVALYNHAARLFRSYADDGSSHNIFFIAVSNNLGHAYSALYCPEKASRCFRQLANAISNYSDEDEELDVGFVSNALSLVMASSTAAAA
jgi:tetratricopeptide (TPR) repeat protein